MHVARGAMGIAVVDGKIYAIGGSTATDIVSTNEQYNPITDTWVLRQPMPTPRNFLAIAVYQSKIYCIGGYTRNAGAIGVNEVYDPNTDAWEIKTPMPTSRADMQANLVNGKIYCIGGTTSKGVVTSVNEVYDPSTDSWSNESSLPVATAFYASTVFNENVYIIGGVSLAGKLNQIFDTRTKLWTSGAPPPNGGIEVAVATVGVMAPQRFYVLNNDGVNQIYDPKKDTWTLGSSIPTKDLVKFGVTAVNDSIYVIGGTLWTHPYPLSDFVNETAVADNLLYMPIDYGTPDPSYVLQTTPPRISVQSPLNEAYNESSLSLVFTVDKSISWISYSLDGKTNLTINGNITLTDLSNGQHNLTVYANDTYGNIGASEVFSFTTAKPESFPTLPAVAVSVFAVVVVVAGLLVYFKKHKPVRML
jgi:hypothetical protein